MKHLSSVSRKTHQTAELLQRSSENMATLALFLHTFTSLIVFLSLYMYLP
ncbi:hypothetical protein CDL12_24856 [Handroanthus impetiginosus]|uniref:Uncharacterized protein n=1 Tax=Handroanthus impetiginosus TaxID=429701 RepID=A0A2G9GCC0_9LAMI|nr:hypothetical protein CDL12_24856 [Handroanthus impetiginosus]